MSFKIAPFKAASIIALGVVFATLEIAPAQAFVQTSASLLLAQTDGVIASYNIGPFRNQVGAFTSDTCNGQLRQPVPTCSGTLSGPADTTGLLTSSTDQVSLAATLGPNRFGTFALPQSGFASARGNLSTGTIGTSAIGTFADIFGTGGQDGTSARGSALISDGLHFNVAGASSGTVTDIAVTFSVHGTIGRDPQFFDDFGVTSELLFGTAKFDSSVTTDRSGGNRLTDSATGWVSFGFTSQTADDIIFTGIYALTGPTTDLGITESLNANCGNGINCDFSHTGTVAFALPTGVSFRSDSGVFLAPTAVPEPSSLLILSAGLGVVMMIRRRRPAAPQASQGSVPFSFANGLHP